jgi:anti-sigma28 factor (negative regulator of flagellin synthesis)
MDEIKVGSARIYQLFSNNTEGSSSQQDSNAKSTSTAQQANIAYQSADAVKVSASVQEEAIRSQSKVQDLKQKVQSGEYQKQISSQMTAKSIVEFYSA